MSEGVVSERQNAHRLFRLIEKKMKK